MKTDKYSDRTDGTTTTALYEYGIIRNPDTDKCIVCMNCHEVNANFGNIYNEVKPRIKVMHISLDDVKETLEEMPDGYFDFIGGVREKDMRELSNDYLTGHITSLEMWCGAFQLNMPY